MSDQKQIAKLMDQILKNKNFMQQIYKTSYNYDDVNKKLGVALSYIISTRSNKELLHGDTKGLYGLGDLLKDKNIDKEQFYKNAIQDGVMTHSFNGSELNNVKKRGLGDKQNYNQEAYKDLQELENLIGCSEYLKNQSSSDDEFYYTAPGAKSFHYASAMSPERLFLGPLKQDRGKALPVIIGESKIDYFMRVATEKIKNLPEEKREYALNLYKKVINNYCGKNPQIAIFPINSKHYKLNASHASYQNGSDDLNNVIKENIGDNAFSFFTEDTYLIENNNLGNLVSSGVKISGKDIEFIETPDSFEMMQEIAKAHGLKNGEQIDYTTGQKYVPQIDKVDESDINQIKEDNPNEFAKNEILIEKIKKTNEMLKANEKGE